jgi:hypothetical protein
MKDGVEEILSTSNPSNAVLGHYQTVSKVEGAGAFVLGGANQLHAISWE